MATLKYYDTGTGTWKYLIVGGNENSFDWVSIALIQGM